MPATPSTYVILLRAIGPATHGLMSMAQWREAAERAGFEAPETLVNTGNMVAGFAGSPRAAQEAMAGVLRGFGLPPGVIPVLRRPAVLHRLVQADPVAEAAAQRPNQTGVYFFAGRPDFGWLAQHEGPETIHVVEGHLVVDFTRDVARSARLIRQIDRHCGPNTARNWNTLRRLADRCAGR